MLVNDVLIDAFERIKQVVHTNTEGLSDKSLSYRPAADANTMGWLIWHLARVQDDHIAKLANSSQIWYQGWKEKFGLPFSESATGYGQSAKEVGAVNASAKLLLGYFDAVHESTIKWIKSLTEEDYRKVVDENWDPPVTLAVRLVSVISDDLQHAGQAAYIHGLIEKPR